MGVYQLRLFGILLRPSLFSGVITTIVTFAALGVSNWPYVTSNPMLHDYFLGQYGITTVLSQSRTSLFDFRIFDQAYTYYIVIILIGVLFGLLIYIVLQSFSHGLAGAHEAIDEIEEAQGASRQVVEREIGVRWGVRILGVVLWAAYWIFFINALLPFCILTSRFGVGSFDSLAGWGYGLLGFVTLWAGLHQHIIFARLVALRPRLFGGRATINAELYE